MYYRPIICSLAPNVIPRGEEPDEPPLPTVVLPPTALAFRDVYNDVRDLRRAAPRSSLEGLKPGARGEEVVRLQRILRKWNPRLGLQANGVFDQQTDKAVSLYRAIYTGPTGTSSIDAVTARHLAGMEDGSFWKDPPQKTPGQRLLYEAAQHLGVPYRLGGDGVHSTDCGLLTSHSAHSTGLATGLSRMADEQYRSARRGQNGLRMSQKAAAGDLLFYRVPTRQSGEAYQGITHVGLHVDDKWILAASSGAGRVVIQPQSALRGYLAGAATLTESAPTTSTPPRPTPRSIGSPPEDSITASR